MTGRPLSNALSRDVKAFLAYVVDAVFILILSVLWAVVVLAFFIAAVDLIGRIG